MAYEPTNPPKKGKHLYKHGLSTHPMYGAWRRMIQRCEDVNAKDYKHYGGKGIKVCDSWRQSFPKFLSDMGERPEGMTLDRIDSNGNYDPDNCRWVGRQEQMQNRCSSIWIEYEGIKKCLAQWARDLGINEETLKYRIKSNWPLAEALTNTIYNSKRKEVNYVV